MKTNIGDADRTARCAAGATLAWFAFAHIPYGTIRITLVLIAAVLLLSTVTGWSLLYAILRISTVESSKQPNAPTRLK